MTSRATEIQTLIAEIDNLLANKGKRLSRVLSPQQGQEPKLVLERIRSFLIDLVENETEGGSAAQLTPLQARYIVRDGSLSGSSGYFMAEDDSFGGIAPQASLPQNPSSQLNNPVHEISTLIEPLKVELRSLLEERQNLVEEIRQLEQQRLHNYSLVQQMATQEQAIAEFLQVLANRVGENPPQAANLVSILKSSHVPSPSPVSAESAQQVERLSQLASELDRKLIALDGTVNIVFEALQRNVHNHHDSLSEAMVRMGDRGSQAEQLLKHFIDNLIQQLLSLPAIDNYNVGASAGSKDVQESNVTAKRDKRNLIPEVSRTTSRQAKVSQSTPIVENLIEKSVGKSTDIGTTELPDIDTGLLDDGNVTPDLDALLLELSQDSTTSQQSLASFSPPQVNQESQLISLQELNQAPQNRADEVDRLYASLFIQDGETNPNPLIVANQLNRNPIGVTQDLSIPTVIDLNASTSLFSPIPSQEQINLEEANFEQIDLDSSFEISEQVDSNQFNDITDAVSPVTSFINPETIINDHASNVILDGITQDSIREASNGEEIASETTLQDTTISSDVELISIENVENSENAENTENQDENQDIKSGFVSDPWFDGNDAGLLNLQDLQSQNLDTQNLDTMVSGQTNDAWQAFFGNEITANTTLNQEEPTDSDRITVLTDLIFVDAEDAIASSDISNISETEPKPIEAENPTASENVTTNYITASPQEILLSKATAEIDAAMPNISLDEEQLQQLDRDLANFDSEQNIFASASSNSVVEAQPDIFFNELPNNPNIEDSEINIPNLNIPDEASVENANFGISLDVSPDVSPDITTNASLDISTNASPDISPDISPDVSLNEAPVAEAGTEIKPEIKPELETEDNQNIEITANGSANDLVDSENNLSTNNLTTNNLIPISGLIGNTDLPINTQDSAWYLGIDLGTTGISAALLNRSTTEVYPLYWSAETENSTNGVKRSFRLPAEVYLPATAGKPIGDNQETTASEASSPTPQHLFSAELKPYLQLALAYRSDYLARTTPIRQDTTAIGTPQPQLKWEPVLQLNEVATVPLVWMVRSLSKLLLTLKSDRNSTTLGLAATAMGLNPENFANAIDNLAGVICSVPSNWSEQYRFNIREALLISKIISHPQQVFFVEEAIATLLSELDGCNGEEVKLKSRTGSAKAKSSDYPLIGNTLIMNIGASSTEMALVDIPDHLIELTHSDFMLHSFAYGGKSIEQDIICQLLLPPKWRQSNSIKLSDKEAVSSNPWNWQPSIQGLENTRLSSLQWEELTLPRPGEPDGSERIRLQQRLESSLLGQALLDAATAMKLILQHQESFSLQLADQSWTLQRRDLESQVFVPFVRRLNRELNRLLVARGIPTEAINQAILSGGVASLGAVSRWLRQKLPNARIIQDLYLGENGAPTCSRVAYGLCLLPLHPQVLEIPRQQYTDYFLFTELLKVLPERALSFGEVVQLFEERGINTRSCQQRLLAFLEGELPAGLIPNSIDSLWLVQSSVENPDYRAIASTPLFEKQGSLSYVPNTQQIQQLLRYLDAVKGSTQQSLEEPYTVNFAVGARE
ncbi:hypothetical protein [Brunnivagina elsteri]|uniref:Uncharacterized protein n=1 Tax=Brunnivagina elsteri CCALA 953 TaxID=987040 RepID=A0A2A2TIJ3_9CYAN|nr:hypothetical protein [Calothrix elsteri]PAX53813.1 hypothetical protein CK510_13300 [Calothrix elsteri CCALA 953]